jgi:hypothetical protein
MFLEGEFLDTVIGIPDSRTEMVTLRPPDDGTTTVKMERRGSSPAAGNLEPKRAPRAVRREQPTRATRVVGRVAASILPSAARFEPRLPVDQHLTHCDVARRRDT